MRLTKNAKTVYIHALCNFQEAKLCPSKIMLENHKKTHFLTTKTSHMHKEIIFPKNNCSTQPKIHRRSLKNNHRNSKTPRRRLKNYHLNSKKPRRNSKKSQPRGAKIIRLLEKSLLANRKSSTENSKSLHHEGV